MTERPEARDCPGEDVTVIEVTCDVLQLADGWDALIRHADEAGKMLYSATVVIGSEAISEFRIVGYLH